MDRISVMDVASRRFCWHCNMAHNRWYSVNNNEPKCLNCDFTQDEGYEVANQICGIGGDGMMPETYNGVITINRTGVAIGFNQTEETTVKINYKDRDNLINFLCLYYQLTQSFQLELMEVIKNQKVGCEVKLEWAKTSLENIADILEEAKDKIDEC